MEDEMANTQTLAATPARSHARGGLLAALVRTEDDWTQTLLRVVLGVVMFPHGAQKLLGWFGGFGFEGTMGYLTGSVGLPWIVGLLVIVAEFFGSLALVFGFLGRAGALGVIAVMVGAVLTTHLPNGFFMNWSGQQAGEGFEYHLLALAISLAVIIRGSGAASVDRALTARLRS
jgi:putative oxidoreductase